MQQVSTFLYEKGVLHGSLFASKLVKNLGAQEKPKHTTNNKTQSKAFAQMFVCEKGWVRITPMFTSTPIL